MVWLWAADAPAGGSPSEALIYAIGAFLGVVVMALGNIVVQALKARTERTEPAQLGGGAVVQLATDLGKLVERADDTDETLELQDRTLDRLVRWVEGHDPDGWGRM